MSFQHAGVTRKVYRRGAGPGVVILHELPGLIPEDIALGARVADAGFTVFMPSLIGTPGKRDSCLYIAEVGARLCISREFNNFATRRRSPITNWVRALARAMHAELGGPGVGAIGMCLTGNFALALMLDPILAAPVVCHPALPAPCTRAQRAALQLSDAELRIVRERVAAGTPVLGLRFTEDRLCPKERFDRLTAELGDGFERIDIDSSEGNPYGIRRDAHSVLTRDLVDRDGHPTREALARLLAFLREHLRGTTG
ncbi:dienelactone hydrolase family protein [Sorangium sp. So ce134]